MRSKFFTITLCLLLSQISLKAQTFTSNLPIVVITPDAQIVDASKVGGAMKIIYNGEGQTNSLTDVNYNYNGRIGIEIRGSSSQALDKKAYGFETRKADGSNNNVSLMGMPSENDWILNGLAYDPSCLHDYLAYKFFRDMGNYGARTVFCEVFINNEYRGLYLLQEKIKEDGNRVNITEMTNADNAAPNLTGGYIIKADKTTGGDPVAFVMEGNNRSGYSESIDFVHDTPEPSLITSQQKTYIESVFRKLETATNNNNSSLSDGYPSIIDVPAFVDYMLVNEIGSCVDAYKISTYFHQDRIGKLRAGPVWDFNYGFGLVGGGVDGRSGTTEWQFHNGNQEGPKFFYKLFQNDTYRCYMSRRWNELTQSGMPLNIDVIKNHITSMQTFLAPAVARDEAKWHRIGDFANNIAFLKTFITDRSTWITNNIGSFSACNNVSVPALVINEIMYNPAGGSDHEFLEIKNNGSSGANLAGLYFSGLGLSYQFPAVTLPAGGFFLVASNSTAFNTKYGKAANGQFARNLSNKSQKLVLSDAFGNTIDLVEYFDSSPWPTDADGGGKSLELKSAGLDNNVGTNWTTRASNDGSPGMENSGALPVTLVSFVGMAEGNSVALSWNVTSEVNVEKYTVERSRNGKVFSAVGDVEATESTRYHFSDKSPFSGNSYYRLKAIDRDQTYAYSKIISVSVKYGNETVLYPNPVSDLLTIDISEDLLAKPVALSLISVNGKVIMKRKIKNTAKKESFDFSKFAPGNYLIRIESDGDVITRPLEIVR
jgi:spore coat protein CotH